MSNEEELQPDNNEVENMEDENVLDEVSSDEEQEVSAPEAEMSEGEKLARSNGWDPSKGSKTWQEFNLTGELIESKNIQKKLQKDLETLVKYHENSIEAQKLRFKQELDAKLQYAKETGDMEQVENLTKEKVDIEQRDKLAKEQEIRKQIDMAVASFAQRNAYWYNQESYRNEAVQLESEIISGAYQARTGIPQPANYDGVLAQIEMAMKYNHPEIGGSTQVPARPTLAPGKSSVNKGVEEDHNSDKVAYSKLSAEDKEAYNILSRSIGKHGAKISVKEFIQKWK